MLNLFEKAATAHKAVIYPANWNTVRNALNRNLVTMMDYYRHAAFAVTGEHLLVRLLQTLSTPKTLSLERYYNNAVYDTLNTSRALNLTSSVSNGKIHEGVFYGKGTYEVIITHDDEFNVEHANSHWEIVRAIRVLRHPRSDLNFDIPLGNNLGNEKGIAVIAINMPLLAVQYRAWWITNSFKSDEEEVLGTAHFIHRYVLPGMLPSHVDYALLNRLRCLSEGRSPATTPRHHGIAIVREERQVDQCLDYLLNQISKLQMDFDRLLQDIPAISRPDMRQALRLPDVAKTRQVEWALLVSRLDILNLLADLSRQQVHGKNGNITYELGVLIRKLHNNQSLYSNMQGPALQLMLTELDDLLNKLNQPLLSTIANN